MSFDLNSAETGGGTSEPMPDGTVVRAVMNIQPGGSGDGGWLTTSSKTGNLYLNVEWTVISAPYAKRKFWDMLHFTEKSLPISMRNMRAIVEANYGISPSDMSDAAVAKRRCGFPELQGMEACMLLKIEVDDKGQYPDKNRPSAYLTPGERKYIPRDGAAPAAAPASAPASAPVNGYASQQPAAAQTNKPIWAA